MPHTPTKLLHLCGTVARRRLAWSLLLLTAGITHAACHGAVAWIAAMLGRTVVQDDPSRIGWIDAPPLHLAVMGLAVVFAKGLFGVLASWAQTRLSAEAGQQLRDDTVHALLQAGPSAPAPTTVARLVSRVREAEHAVGHGPFSVVRALAQLVPVAAGLAVLSPTLTLLAGAVLVPFTAALALVRRKWRTMHEASMASADELHEEMDDLIRHLDLWRTYGTGEHIRRVLRRLGHRAADARARSETLGVAISSANEVLGAAALIAVLFVASLGFGLVDGGSVIAFIAIFFMAYRPLRDLGDARTAWLRGREALAVLGSLHHVSASDDEAAAPCAPGTAQVRVDGLRVPGKSPTVSFDLLPGRMIALSGATGAGKTTLLRALLGLEPDAAGHVSVDGTEVTPGKVGPAYRPFAWVPQDAPVVSGSLQDNLEVAGADLDSARTHLSRLGADVLGRLADDKLGAAGRTLSGGERRWLALARALATGLPVLLLDEPTVGLDRRARTAVLRILEQTKGRRTLLVASHDEAVLALADEVVSVG